MKLKLGCNVLGILIVRSKSKIIDGVASNLMIGSYPKRDSLIAVTIIPNGLLSGERKRPLMINRSKIFIGTRTVLAKTCNGCFKLLPGSEFRRELSGYLHTYCKLCCNRMSNRSTKTSNNETLDKASSSGQPWTDKEVALLWQMFNDDCSGKEVALKLGRSINAVYQVKNKTKGDYDGVDS